MTICKHINRGTSAAMRKYTFPAGELVVYVGTKRPCKFIPEQCTYVSREVPRAHAAKALKQLKRECKSVTSDDKIQGEV